MGGVPPPVKVGSCQGRLRYSGKTSESRHLSLRRAALRGYGLAAFEPGVWESMYAVLNLVDTVIRIYIWLLIIQAVLSWLVAFGVVNRHNRFIGTVEDFLWRITEPALRPIRRILPNLGGIDISPIILILLLYFIRNLIFEYFA
jgi:YggT family protein